MNTGQTIRLRVGAAYRDREITFSLPESWDVRFCPPNGGTALTPGAVRRTFARPVGSAPIREAARGARTAAILVDDFRRPTPAEFLCNTVIDQLDEAGIEKEGISIILGNGAHRVMNHRECRHRLGTAMDRVGQVVSHDAFSPDVTFVGLTKGGTPVLVNRVAAEADFSISMSTVYPHTIAAWGGGAKMVLPGICHVSTTHYHHTRMKGGPWGGDPRKNPGRQDIEEAAELLGLNMVICAVINENKELCGLRVGTPRKAYLSAIKLARKAYATRMPEAKPDFVIANAYPMDGDPTQIGKTEIPAKRFGVPILIVIDFADPCPWHGVYHGPRRAFLRTPQPPLPERTPELLEQANVFVYCPQTGHGYSPANKSWYCDDNWDRLMDAMLKRFPKASVAVLPAAPLQITE